MKDSNIYEVEWEYTSLGTLHLSMLYLVDAMHMATSVTKARAQALHAPIMFLQKSQVQY